MRVCLVYDCLYPWTIGGAEKWYRRLARALAEEGHQVTVLTLRQWPDEEPPRIPGVEIVAVGPSMPLYGDGRRRRWPPLRFGLGVFVHLARHGQAYDLVHCAAFPYFAAGAAAISRRLRGFALAIDWWEVWTDAYWRSYLGKAGWRAGSAVQRWLVRQPHVPVAFSRLHGERLVGLGAPRPPLSIRGAYPADASSDPSRRPVAEPRDVLFVGRLIPEKRALAIPFALLVALQSLPTLTASFIGDGPEGVGLADLLRDLGLSDRVDRLGFVSEAELDRRLRRALCLVLPSQREGFGFAVLDAISRGTPAIVVDHPDSAAVELIEPGVNGFVAPSDDATDLAAAILAVAAGGKRLRGSTAAWWTEHGEALSLPSGVAELTALYAAIAPSWREPFRGGSAEGRVRSLPRIGNLRPKPRR